MKKFQIFLIVSILCSSCFQSKNDVPAEIHQFAEEAIEASINANPLDRFYQTYFDHSVSQAYFLKLKQNLNIWKGAQHETVLRKASLTHKQKETSEYLLSYWVTFKEGRKFSYEISVVEKAGIIALKRFEPINVDIDGSMINSDTKFDIPNYTTNWLKILFVYTITISTLLFLIYLAIWKRKYAPLLSIPFLVVYWQKMTVYSFDTVVQFQNIKWGLPFFQDIDLHFTSISLKPIGVFCIWIIIGLYLIFSLIKNKNRHKNNQAVRDVS